MLHSTTLSPMESKETIDMTNKKTTSVDGRAEAMFQALFAGQLEAMARQMATQFDIDADAAVKMATEHAATIDLKQVAKPTRKSSGKPRKPKAPLTADNRCMARVWGSGSGNDQCKCARGEDTDYCSRHAKQAAICDEPCHLDENGKKKGLFCGRIDQFHGNTGLAPFMVGGEIRIEWNSLPHKEAICDGLENETIRHRKKTKKSKKTSVAVVEVNEDELAAMVSSTGEEDAVVNDVDETSILESIGDDMMGSNESKVSVAEAARRASITSHESRIKELQNMDDLSDVEEEDDDTSLDVEEWDHNGVSYLVCRETLAVYNEDGEEIGKWGEGDTIGAPVPEE
jgi:hypothetical protein